MESQLLDTFSRSMVQVTTSLFSDFSRGMLLMIMKAKYILSKIYEIFKQMERLSKQNLGSIQDFFFKQCNTKR